MIREKEKEEERALSYDYKARVIPPHVKMNKFEQLKQK